MKDNYYNIPRGNASFSARLCQLMNKYGWCLVVMGLILGLTTLWSFNDHDDLNQYKNGKKTAIVVLGGGLTSDGQVPQHTQLRIDRAISLYKELKEKEDAKIITLSGGTTHKPNPRDEDGFVVWEASAAAKRIIEMGIDEKDVYEENFSLDTIGNAYFLRTIHLIPGRFNKVIVITNNWHMPRTKSIFETVLQLPPHHPHKDEDEEEDREEGKDEGEEDFDELSDWFDWWWSSSRNRRRKGSKSRLELVFDPVEAGITDQSVLTSRIERETISLQSFEKNLKKKWKSFSDLHEWIFTDHDAYASKRLKKKRKKIDESVLKTY